MPGVLFLVVGPSGVGKDTLIDAARDALEGDPDFVFVRRVVTRPREAGGEPHEAMTAEAFAAAEAAGEFAVTWGAHGLFYGVRNEALASLAHEHNVVVNASRRTIEEFAASSERTVVLSITAPPELVRARLEARGREDAADVAARLARRVPLPAAVRTVEIVNDGSVTVGAERFLAALIGSAHLPLTIQRGPIELTGEALCLVNRNARTIRANGLNDAGLVELAAEDASVRARLALTHDETLVDRHGVALSERAFAALGLREGAKVTLQRSPSPRSRDVLRKKIGGGELSANEIARVVRDLSEGRYAQPEIAGFLVAAANSLTVAEVTALARARAEHFDPFQWDGRLVVDKHSLGGVAGRITMIVVPIVAAHGLTIPKSSSRAITSAAGTADVMECVANVDVSRAELKSMAERAGGAIVWSGRISHSAVDDVMNAIVRPLGIRSARLDVSSILSKKLAVGATHAVIDIPVGPHAKVASRPEGEALARLFEEVGEALGLTVRGHVSDGARPVGRALGPALELEEVMAVLDGRPWAPEGLRRKALAFAATILSFDPALERDPLEHAHELLASGAAREAFDAIVAAQGPSGGAAVGPFVRTVTAHRAGTVTAIDGYAAAGVARAAGAPSDKGAGVRLNVDVGERVRQGAPLYDVIASAERGLDHAGAAQDGIVVID